MENKQQIDKFTAGNQEMESLENPFDKLAPEVVEHILNFLTDIPHKMLASGVCRLWRELVNWKKVKQLQLNFAHLHINKVPLPLSKWSTALESLLPKVTLTSLQIQLPRKAPKRTKRGFYLPWPLSLLDCGVIVNQLTNQQQVSLASITQVRISGRPDNSQFEFSCHLLELCPSLTHLNLSLASDKFDQALLKSALTNKPLVELNLNVGLLMGNCSSVDFARLCQVSAPGTLKSLKLDTGSRDRDDNPVSVVFCFDAWCRALEEESSALSAVEELFIGTSHFVVSELLDETFEILPQFGFLVHEIMPSLNQITYSVPLVDAWQWTKLRVAVEMMALLLDHKVHLRLLTSHCMTSFIYLYRHLAEGAGDKILTETGFHITPEAVDGDELNTVTYDRLPPTAPSACRCDICLSEFHWAKEKIIEHLEDGSGTQASAVDLKLFSCVIPRLRSDLQQIYPTLSISKVFKGKVKIAIDGNVLLTAEGLRHNSITVGDVQDGRCAGCVMMVQDWFLGH